MENRRSQRQIAGLWIHRLRPHFAQYVRCNAEYVNPLVDMTQGNRKYSRNSARIVICWRHLRLTNYNNIFVETFSNSHLTSVRFNLKFPKSLEIYRFRAPLELSKNRQSFQNISKLSKLLKIIQNVQNPLWCAIFSVALDISELHRNNITTQNRLVLYHIHWHMCMHTAHTGTHGSSVIYWIGKPSSFAQTNRFYNPKGIQCIDASVCMVSVVMPVCGGVFLWPPPHCIAREEFWHQSHFIGISLDVDYKNPTKWDEPKWAACRSVFVLSLSNIQHIR